MGDKSSHLVKQKSLSSLNRNSYLDYLTPSIKMVVKHKVEGFEAFVAKAEELSSDKSKTLVVMFSGTKDENGKSWCPDCVVAEPVVDECLAACGDDVVFLYVSVGDRAFWKDPKS